MKTKIALVAALLLLHTALIAQTEGPKKAAATVFNEFLAAFTNADSDKILGLFSEDALFWGTSSKTLVQDSNGIRSYFSFLDEQSPGEATAIALDHSIVMLSDTEAVISGIWQVVTADENTPLPLRVSVTVSKRNGAWKIVQFHNSRVPK